MTQIIITPPISNHTIPSDTATNTVSTWDIEPNEWNWQTTTLKNTVVQAVTRVFVAVKTSDDSVPRIAIFVADTSARYLTTHMMCVFSSAANSPQFRAGTYVLPPGPDYTIAYQHTPLGALMIPPRDAGVILGVVCDHAGTWSIDFDVYIEQSC